MQITSPSNEKIKHAKRVRDGREADLIFIEGVRLAEEALSSGIEIEIGFADGGVQEEPRTAALLNQLSALGLPVMLTAPEVIRSLSDTVQSQGIILLAKRPVAGMDLLLQNPSTLLLGLDRLQDPGNLGTLIRTGEAAGVGGILALKGCTDAFPPKALRSSMGSSFRLPILLADPANLTNFQQTRGFQMVAAAGEGEMDYCDYDWQQPTLLLLGNEGRGVAPELMDLCDVRLRIPMQAGVESLNVAAAGAVMLFEAARQRRLKAGN